ncbi:MAG: hypothetical protein N3G76_00540 [Candidatus Micrarchaeota archaeon]|nr:hypothetical protein [Candidatus Micrarchaeota archaeon]
MIPGIHINTVAELLYYVGAGGFGGAALLYILYGISVALDSIYSIAINIPDGATGIAPTASQQLSAKGEVGKGVYSYLMGGIIAVGICIPILPILIAAMPLLFPIVQENMFLALAAVTSVVLLSSFSAANIFAFLIAGALGIFALGASTQQNLIFPMFVGFFTLPMLMLKTRTLQIEKSPRAKINIYVVLIAVVLTALAYLIPGIATPTIIILIAGLFTKIRDDEFVTALGAINASTLIFSIMMVDIIGKARVGTAIVAQNMYHTFIFGDLMLALLGAAAFGITALAILHNLRAAISLFSPFTHTLMKLLLAAYLALLVFLTTGSIGIIVLGAATAIGVIALLIRARRTTLMGSIILNSIVYYMGKR